jgi:hypothetical protein
MILVFMPSNEPDIAAWLLCEDILNKIKSELITQAMDTLDEAITSKAIDVKGSLITLPDKPSETEMKIFIINRLLGEKERIMEMYNGYLAEIAADGKADANKLQQKERLEKFLLYIEKISMLMDYSAVVDAWMLDINTEAKEHDASQIIKKTASKEASRQKVLDYVLKNKTIIKEEILSEEEMGILKRAA